MKTPIKISTNINRSFKFDPNSSENFGRFRINDPKIFIRMWTRQDGIDKGISYIVGVTKNKNFSVQSVRFNKNIWTQKTAKIWWKKNKKRFLKYKTEKNPSSSKAINTEIQLLEKELELMAPVVLE